MGTMADFLKIGDHSIAPATLLAAAKTDLDGYLDKSKMNPELLFEALQGQMAYRADVIEVPAMAVYITNFFEELVPDAANGMDTGTSGAEVDKQNGTNAGTSGAEVNKQNGTSDFSTDSVTPPALTEDAHRAGNGYLQIRQDIQLAAVQRHLYANMISIQNQDDEKISPKAVAAAVFPEFPIGSITKFDSNYNQQSFSFTFTTLFQPRNTISLVLGAASKLGNFRVITPFTPATKLRERPNKTLYGAVCDAFQDMEDGANLKKIIYTLAASDSPNCLVLRSDTAIDSLLASIEQRMDNAGVIDIFIQREFQLHNGTKLPARLVSGHLESRWARTQVPWLLRVFIANGIPIPPMQPKGFGKGMNAVEVLSACKQQGIGIDMLRKNLNGSAAPPPAATVSSEAPADASIPRASTTTSTSASAATTSQAQAAATVPAATSPFVFGGNQTTATSGQGKGNGFLFGSPPQPSPFSGIQSNTVQAKGRSGKGRRKGPQQQQQHNRQQQQPQQGQISHNTKFNFT